MKNLIVLILGLASLCVLLVGCGDGQNIQSVALTQNNVHSSELLALDWEFQLLEPIQGQKVLVLSFEKHPAQAYHYFLEGVGFSEINFEKGFVEEIFGGPKKVHLVLEEGWAFKGLNNMPRYAVWRDHDYSNVGDYEGRWNLVRIDSPGKGTVIGITNKLPDY